MTRELPAWLPTALGEHPLEVRAPNPELLLSAGDIRVADFGPVRRLVLVLDVPDEYAAVVALLSNELDLITDQDVVVRPSDGLPYPVVIETDVVGAVVQGLIGRLIRRLPEALLVNIRRAAFEGEFDSSLDGRRGMPLRSGPDPRRIWKEADGELFDAHVVGAEDSRPCILDAAVLAPDSGVEPQQAQAALLRVLAGDCAVGPRATVAILQLARRSAGGAPWLHDAARSLANRNVISDTADTPRPLGVPSGPVRRFEPYPIADLIADLASFPSHAAVITTRSAWVGDIAGHPIQIPRDRQPAMSVDLIDCAEVAHA